MTEFMKETWKEFADGLGRALLVLFVAALAAFFVSKADAESYQRIGERDVVIIDWSDISEDDNVDYFEEFAWQSFSELRAIYAQEYNIDAWQQPRLVATKDVQDNPAHQLAMTANKPAVEVFMVSDICVFVTLYTVSKDLNHKYVSTIAYSKK